MDIKNNTIKLIKNHVHIVRRIKVPKAITKLTYFTFLTFGGNNVKFLSFWSNKAKRVLAILPWVSLLLKSEEKVDPITKKTTKDYFLLVRCTSSKKSCYFKSDLKEVVNCFESYCGRMELDLNRMTPVFEEILVLKGLGFRATLEGDKIKFKLGKSHLTWITLPKGVNFFQEPKSFCLWSHDRVLLGNFVNEIIKLKIPDPYKGKGIKRQYDSEKLKIIRKK